MKTMALTGYYSFKASHSLPGFEQPHFHLWKISVEFRAAYPLKSDRVIDLVLLQSELAKIAAPLENTYLNDTLGASPTSENMSVFFWDAIEAQFPNEHLHSVSVCLCTLSGENTGTAKLIRGIMDGY